LFPIHFGAVGLFSFGNHGLSLTSLLKFVNRVIWQISQIRVTIFEPARSGSLDSATTRRKLPARLSIAPGELRGGQIRIFAFNSPIDPTYCGSAYVGYPLSGPRKSLKTIN
jgi:hypothetical protein